MSANLLSSIFVVKRSPRPDSIFLPELSEALELSELPLGSSKPARILPVFGLCHDLPRAKSDQVSFVSLPPSRRLHDLQNFRRESPNLLARNDLLDHDQVRGNGGLAATTIPSTTESLDSKRFTMIASSGFWPAPKSDRMALTSRSMPIRISPSFRQADSPAAPSVPIAVTFHDLRLLENGDSGDELRAELDRPTVDSVNSKSPAIEIVRVGSTATARRKVVSRRSHRHEARRKVPTG